MSGKLFRLRPAVVVAATLLLVGGVAAQQQSAATNGEWRRIGGDGGNTRYSPLDQINATNVKNLKVAWTWKGDNFGSGVEIKNENTPLMVNGVLYFTAGDRRAVVAADPGTGETLWTYRYEEPATRTTGIRKNNRGVAYWTDGRQSKILTVTPGYQLDRARRQDRSPGCRLRQATASSISPSRSKRTRTTIRRIGHLMNTSPPLVFGNVAIIPTVDGKRAQSEIDEVPEGGHDGLRRADREEAVELPYHSTQGRVRRRHVAERIRTSTRDTRAPGPRLRSMNSSGTCTYQ